MLISAKQTRVYGGGVRGMTVPTGIGLKFTQTPVKPPQRLIIIARNFSIYIIFYKIRSCREPSKQFVQAPIAYKYIKVFFYWEAFEYLLRVLWFSERSEACRPSWIVWDGRLMTDEWHLINHWYFTINIYGDSLPKIDRTCVCENNDNLEVQPGTQQNGVWQTH